jgi:hypothetical protein
MQLVEKMMKNYKARVEVRPVARSNQPVIVSFDLAYSQLIDLVKPFLVCFCTNFDAFQAVKQETN